MIEDIIMTTTIIIVFIMEMILCILLLMKGCMFCKYTPATLKKELKDPDFYDFPDYNDTGTQFKPNINYTFLKIQY